MLAYVFLIAAAMIQLNDDLESDKMSAKPSSTDQRVICWDGTGPKAKELCPVPAPDRSRPAKPRGNPGGWATTSDYPARALSAMQEGTTGFRLTIGPDGRTQDCKIIVSSGVAELDDATCMNVVRRARFDPALDSSGNPTTGTYSNRINWRIPSNGSTISGVLPSDSLPRPPQTSNSLATRILGSDYPELAKAEGRQGVTRISVQVSKVGDATACSVTKSSGHADLDEKACALSKNWVYTPALDSQGAAVAGISSHDVNWRLPEQALGNAIALKSPDLAKTYAQLLTSGSMKMSFTVKADGSIANCEVERAGKLYGFETSAFPCEPMAKMVSKANGYFKDNAIDRNVRHEIMLEIDPPFPPVPLTEEPSIVGAPVVKADEPTLKTSDD